MADFSLKLADFTFSDLEIPEKIDFGGSQMMVVHKLVGGRKVIDTLGRDDKPLEWSGLLFGEAALQRARYLDFLRAEGKHHTLTWHDMAYTVVVKEFHCSFERIYKLPYKITCEVVSDDASPIMAAQSQDDPSQAIETDMTEAFTVTGSLGDAPDMDEGTRNGLSEKVQTPLSLFHTVNADIRAVRAAISDAQAAVQAAITSTSNAVQNISTLGGILPNNPISQNALAFASSASSVSNMAKLENIQYLLTRAGKNIDQQSQPSDLKQIQVSGGTLYTVAKSEYGDASMWDVIGNANGIFDPVIVGVVTLVIPPKPVVANA